MSRDQKVYLYDILQSIQAIEEYTSNINKTDFMNNKILQDAVIRRLEIIGEAAKKINIIIKKETYDIPWKKISGLRDILIHEYFGIKIERIWTLIQKDLPRLKKNLKEIIEKDYV